MVQRVTTPFGTFIKPDAYPNVTVKSQPVGVATSGVIVIIGEADCGPTSYLLDSEDGVKLKDNYFSPSQVAQVQSLYKSGNIVEAFKAVSVPSADEDIVGAPTKILILKTNKGAKAEATIASSYGTLSDKNFGIPGNKYNYKVIQSRTETAPFVIGDAITIGDGTILNGLNFSVRLQGGAIAAVTLSSTETDHDTLSKLIIELNAKLPSGITASASGTGVKFSLATLTNNQANALGYGRSFEIIDSTSGDLATLGLDAGVIYSAQEPAVQININRSDINLNDSFVAKADVALLIGYEGTTATLSIVDNILSTTVVGGSGTSLSIDLNNFSTLRDLAEYVDSMTGYAASVETLYAQKNPSCLDKVTTLGICSTGTELKPGRVKSAIYNFEQSLLNSANLSFEKIATKGLPNVMTKVAYLSGGAKGATLSSDIVTAMNELKGIDANFVIPLFSRDASEDIAEGLTDSASTYTIDAVNALVKSHLLEMSTAKIKKHRTGFLSYWGTYSEAKNKSSSLAHYRVSLSFQKSKQVNGSGTIVSFLPWYTACIAAGMQAAGGYRGITNKYANIIDYVDPVDFDSNDPGQIEDALTNGLFFLEKSAVGSKWVSDQTTYGVDENFVYNSIQAIYGADLIALDLSKSFKDQFVGASLADVNSATALSFLGDKMETYKTQKFITGSSDAPAGYRNASVSINGPAMYVSVEVKLSTSLYFIPIQLDISQVSNASAQG